MIDGEVEGSIMLRGQTVTVGPNGRVRANIEARTVVLHGRVDGDISCQRSCGLAQELVIDGQHINGAHLD